ncbi:MAG: hypothetical protein JXB00_15240 [Bacteroidales bacterium]|nr:hypothetical protein [Bacteroidales bacterium]
MKKLFLITLILCCLTNIYSQTTYTAFTGTIFGGEQETDYIIQPSGAEKVEITFTNLDFTATGEGFIDVREGTYYNPGNLLIHFDQDHHNFPVTVTTSTANSIWINMDWYSGESPNFTATYKGIITPTWAVNGGSLFTNGNVGIGTQVPYSKLSLGSVSNIANRIAVYEGTDGKNFYGIGIAQPTTGVYGLGLYGGTNTSLPSNTNMHIFIKNNGKIGIGTTIPNAKLDVRGQIIGGFGAESTGGVLDWNDITNTRSGSGYTLLRANAANGPVNAGSGYYHTFNFEYYSKDGSGNITQLAIPYGPTGTINTGLYFRGKYAGNWSSWVKIISENLAGNVGIGTSTPRSKLSLGNSNSDITNRIAVFEGTDGKNFYGIGTVQPTTGVYGLGLYGGTGTSLPTNTNMHVFIKNDGKVGIGTTTPQYGKLQVAGGGANGGITLYDPNGSNHAFQMTADNNIGYLYRGTTILNGLAIDANGNIGIGATTITAKLDVNGNASFGNGTTSKAYIRGNSNFSNAIIPDYTWWGNDQTGLFHPTLDVIGFSVAGFEAMRITNSGIAIGTTDLGDGKLAVNGKILATEVEVKVYPWSDYVFTSEYKLRTLEEVSAFISQNGHLPEVPSAKEVEENGVNLGEMNAILLKKIEELTLYVIEQNKQIEELKKIVTDTTK